MSPTFQWEACMPLAPLTCLGLNPFHRKHVHSFYTFKCLNLVVTYYQNRMTSAISNYPHITHWLFYIYCYYNMGKMLISVNIFNSIKDTTKLFNKYLTFILHEHVLLLVDQ